MLKKSLSDWNLFFSFHPLFEVSLYLTASFVCYYLSYLYLFPFLLFFTFLKKERRLYPAFIILLGLFYCIITVQKMPSAFPLEADVTLKVLDKRTKTFYGKTVFTYKGLLKVIETKEGKFFTDLPCIFTAKKDEMIEGDKDYFLSSCTLNKMSPTCLQLKIKKNVTKIYPIDGKLRLAKWRFHKKSKAEKHLATYVDNQRVLKLLTGISIGYLDHKALQFEFSKVGASHLLAISGFHFSLLSVFLLYLFHFLPKRKIKYILLFICLTLYVFYLGNSASVIRAYIGVSIYILGILLDLRPSPLNTLSLSFILAFLFDPLSLLTASFQLSYLATLALLLFYGPIEIFLCKLIPKRPLQEVLFFPFLDKSLYIFLAASRKDLALGLSVSIATLPCLLYLFNQFPLLSIVYNLVIPFALSFTMMLLVLGYFFSFAPFLCRLIHKINTSYTDFILSLTESPPKELEMTLYFTPSLFAFSFILLFLCLYFSVKTEAKNLIG